DRLEPAVELPGPVVEDAARDPPAGVDRARRRLGRRGDPALGAVGARLLRDRLQSGRRALQRHSGDATPAGGVRAQRHARGARRLDVRRSLRGRGRDVRERLRVRRRDGGRDRRRQRLRRLGQRARGDARRASRRDDRRRLHAASLLGVLEALLRGRRDRRGRHGRRVAEPAAPGGPAPQAPSGARDRRRRDVTRVFARWESLLVLLIVGGGIWSWTLSSFFLHTVNLLDLTTPYAYLGLMAFGLTFVVIAGEIDISVASPMTVSAVSFARLWPARANVGP